MSNKNETVINIKATSRIYCIDENVPEKKVIKRMEQIQKHWIYLLDRGSQFMRDGDKLSVTTSVVNPKLFNQ